MRSRAETLCFFLLIFFNDTTTTEIYTLSLHDALPICQRVLLNGETTSRRQDLDRSLPPRVAARVQRPNEVERPDRKSTRLNSSHANISYAVFCLKKKNNKYKMILRSDQFCICSVAVYH